MLVLHIYSKKEGLNPVFVKANSYIIKKHKDRLLLKNTSNKEKYNLLKLLWLEEYKIQIDNNWTSMIFSSKNHMDLFLIRWG